MDRQRLLELAGIPVTEANKSGGEQTFNTPLRRQGGMTIDDTHSSDVIRQAIEEVLDLVDPGEQGQPLRLNGGESLAIAINKIVKKADAKMKGRVHEAAGESKASAGMTGQEFDFEMEPDYITILKHNKDTGVTIPMDNWDAMVRAYNRIVNKKHNY